VRSSAGAGRAKLSKRCGLSGQALAMAGMPAGSAIASTPIASVRRSVALRRCAIADGRFIAERGIGPPVTVARPGTRRLHEARPEGNAAADESDVAVEPELAPGQAPARRPRSVRT
jgi:hypothetical protein